MPTDFEVVLHRRLNKRTHFFKNDVNFYDIFATIYCRPGPYDMKSLRQSLLIDEHYPSEMKHDWIGEIWYDYDQIINRPPTMILLLSTPCVIISGISDDTATQDAAAAFADENPGLPLHLLVYLWVGKSTVAVSFFR